jgi:hypothetical protein
MVWINSVSNNLPSAQVFVGDINGEAAADYPALLQLAIRD